MNRLKVSLTFKIALWYAIALILLTSVCIGTVLSYGKNYAANAVKTEIMDKVSDTMEDIAEEGENFEYIGRQKYYDEGVYISVYDEEGELIEGMIPGELAEAPAFRPEEITSVEDDEGQRWYVYDRDFKIGDRHVYIRGVAKSLYESVGEAFTKNLFLLVLPIMLVLAIVGGVLITMRLLRPVRRMIGTVEDIRSSGDYSKRVDIGAGKDELHQLADNFNKLFDNVEDSIQKEKQLNSDMSHELKTPLAVIISQSDYAMKKPEYSREALEKVNAEARWMAEMVSSLLTLARSDAGTLVLENQRIDLSSICEMIADQQGFIAAERGINFNSDIEEGIYIYGDEVMLIRAVVNLTDNAMKYGAAENGEIDLGLRTVGDKIVISVRDSGPGVREEERDRIWDRFYRGDTSRSDDDSSGLGLAIVKAIAEAHGGCACAEGSTFCIYLPNMCEKKGK